MIGQLETLLKQLGLDIRKGVRALAGIPYFVRTSWSYSRAAKGSAFPFQASNLRPMLDDRNGSAGALNAHYFFQDLWAARRIFLARPKRHVDIGSSIEGFVAHVLTFMPVEVIDIRPLPQQITGLTFVQEDATTLARFADDSLESLSSLHAVEHFGLGRYGDPLSAHSYSEAMRSLERVLAPNGRLYFSVPIGRQRVQFNSQRIFDPQAVMDGFPGLELVSFSAVDDAGAFHENVMPDHFSKLSCGCGLFEFTKRAPQAPTER